MGIRNNRYEAEVPTVTGAGHAARGPVHADSVRFLAPPRHPPAQVHPARPDDHLRHHRRRPLRQPPAMAMAFAELLNAEARELEALGVDVIQFDEPAFNVFMDEVPTWGVDCLHRAIEGLTCKTAVHICYGYGIQANIDWKETLGDEWRQYEEFFPALNASRIDQVSLECAGSQVPLSVIAALKDKEVLVGAIDVATTDDRDAGEGRRHPPRRPALRRPRAHRRLHQLRHGAAPAPRRRGQAPRPRRRRRDHPPRARGQVTRCGLPP